MPAPDIIKELVRRFDDQADNYISGKYNETQVRREFIDPFFKALGWDIDNAQGYSEAYKDVVHEDSIKIAGGHRAPDYSFRVGGARKFFLEAKKPSVDISDEDKAAFQIRRYGWSSKLPMSIITSFRELAVYDCRIRPQLTDRPAVARIMSVNYKQYVERWDEIAAIFSKEAVYKGAFDRYAGSIKLKKGTAAVDDDFLVEIEGWREGLARHLAIKNQDLTQSQLNFAVQAIIDRIIFLRICEDRGIETYGQLQNLSKKPNIYISLKKLFESADERYNSGLFHFRNEKDRPEAPDTITPKLEIEDKPLKEIMGSLYYPDSPYEFSVIGADILGHVYEQFLGKVIRLTAGHRAVIDEKPEVKKAGGVYYTPTYIVDYIVEQTLGSALDGKSLPEVAKLRVVDPACGSGSFLIAVYQRLLDWYLSKYSENPDKHKKLLYRGKKGEIRLASAERKRILLAHVFGVDLDRQAVEVTKLSLLLKVLEGESSETLRAQLELFRERALPDLADNIKSGNSLIGPDFYRHQQFDLLDEAVREAVNVFDWNAEFPAIMKQGGFDIVVGNPPYINAWVMFEANPEIRNYINSADIFRSADRHWDMYVLFLEKSLDLLRPEGKLAFIIPFSYCIQKYAGASREIILRECKVVSIADLRTVKVFKNVPVITIIPVIEKKKPTAKSQITILTPKHDGRTINDPGQIVVDHKVSQNIFQQIPETMWRLDLDATSLAACELMDAASLKVGDVTWVNYGAQMSSKKKGEFGKDFVLRDHAASKTCKRTISGRDLYRYRASWDGDYVEWALAPRMYGSREPWFFETPKLMIRDITGTHRLELSLDEEKLYCDHTILCALRACDVSEHKEFTRDQIDISSMFSLELMMGLLASRPVSAYYYWQLTGEGVRTGGGFHTYPNTIRALPLFDINNASAAQRGECTKIEAAVRRIYVLKGRLATEKSAQTIKTLERELAALDQEIDLSAYRLYGFSPEQVAAIEKATG